MKLLKLAVISVLVFSLLLLGISLLIPSQVRISRATDINAGAKQIQPYLQNIQQWGLWNIYVDSLKNKNIAGSLKLQSNSYDINITSITDSLIIAGWQLKKGAVFTSSYRLMPHDNNLTTLQWYFDFNIGWYPWQKFSSIIYDGQFGPVMEQSLQRLKAIAENKQ
jgi:hypothetical protein